MPRPTNPPSRRLRCLVSALGAAVLLVLPTAPRAEAGPGALLLPAQCGPAIVASTALAAGGPRIVLLQAGYHSGEAAGFMHAVDADALRAAPPGTAPPRLWSAHLPDSARRNLHAGVALHAAAPFMWSALPVERRQVLDPARASHADSPLLAYLRGESSGEQRNGGEFRDRRSALGTIVNATPLDSHARDHAYQRQPAAAGRGHEAYRGYVEWKRSGRRAAVLVGSNAGMLHVFDARAGRSDSGLELFGYVPRAVHGALAALAAPDAGHVRSVDGPVVEGDVWDGAAWRTVAVGSTGAGPAGLYALDVTRPEHMTGASLLWDIVPREHPHPDVAGHLGHVLQAGVVGSVRDATAAGGAGRWVYITGNGTDSASGAAVLLVFDLFSGALVRAIVADAAGPSPNGLSGVAPVYDAQRNVVAVYAGDLRGQLWRFDLSGGHPLDPDGDGPLTGWQVHHRAAGRPAPLFVATDDEARRQPIVAAPRVAAHPQGGLYVAFGTGRLHGAEDLADRQVQAIYLLHDRGGAAPVERSALRRVDLHESAAAAGGSGAVAAHRRARAPDSTSLSGPAGSGLFVPLVAAGRDAEGERVLVAPILDGPVLLFTTAVPPSMAHPCGASLLYRLDLARGLAHGGFDDPAAGFVAVRLRSAVAGGAMPLPVRRAAEPGYSRLSGAELAAFLRPPAADAPAAAGDRCRTLLGEAGGGPVVLPTACAGVLPLRAWRPLR